MKSLYHDVRQAERQLRHTYDFAVVFYLLVALVGLGIATETRIPKLIGLVFMSVGAAGLLGTYLDRRRDGV